MFFRYFAGSLFLKAIGLYLWTLRTLLTVNDSVVAMAHARGIHEVQRATELKCLSADHSVSLTSWQIYCPDTFDPPITESLPYEGFFRTMSTNFLTTHLLFLL